MRVYVDSREVPRRGELCSGGSAETSTPASYDVNAAQYKTRYAYLYNAKGQLNGVEIRGIRR